MRACSLLALAALLAPFSVAAAEMVPAVTPGHVPEPAGLYRGAMHGYTPSRITGGVVIDTAALADLMASQHPVLLDVAEKDRKPPGISKDTPWLPTHRSIPGAIFLQGGGNGTDDRAYAAAFETRVAALAGDDREKPIVTFCHPDCWGSYNAAKRLIGLGYTHVYWYRDGVEGWQADHETRVASPDPAWVASRPEEATQ